VPPDFFCIDLQCYNKNTMPVTKNSLILVAVMNQPQDLEIARVLGWYRIPLKTTPKVVAVDYLAFYQTGSFTENKWRIEYLAPVRGHELVTRAELFRDQPDHPRAQDLYYKLQLGPLEKLDAPIQAEKWKRITFFYTTGEYLEHARTMNDLVVHSDERRLLWQALRERAEHSNLYETQALPDIDLDPDLLMAILGIREAPEESR
jgi:hypothetical protein